MRNRTQQTAPEPPVTLGLPPEEPEPSADCTACATLDAQRTEARKAGDMSRVSDCNVRIRRHVDHAFADDAPPCDTARTLRRLVLEHAR